MFSRALETKVQDSLIVENMLQELHREIRRRLDQASPDACSTPGSKQSVWSAGEKHETARREDGDCRAVRVARWTHTQGTERVDAF